VATQQSEVARVRLEPQVERISDERDRPDHEVDRRDGQHAHHDDAWKTHPGGAPHDEEAHPRADDVAEHRHQPDDGVDPEAPAGARHRDAVVEEPCQRLDLGQ
jgi:hypothetical protein